MDRGANGVVADNYVRVIDKYHDKTEDVRGIDNNEITSIPSITSGSIALTTSVEVIIVTQQYEFNGKNKTIYSSPQIEPFKKR